MKTSTLRQMSVFAGVACLLATAHSQSVFTNGAGSFLWSTAGNWSGGYPDGSKTISVGAGIAYSMVDGLFFGYSINSQTFLFVNPSGNLVLYNGGYTKYLDLSGRINGGAGLSADEFRFAGGTLVGTVSSFKAFSPSSGTTHVYFGDTSGGTWRTYGTTSITNSFNMHSTATYGTYDEIVNDGTWEITGPQCQFFQTGIYNSDFTNRGVLNFRAGANWFDTISGTGMVNVFGGDVFARPFSRIDNGKQTGIWILYGGTARWPAIHTVNGSVVFNGGNLVRDFTGLPALVEMETLNGRIALNTGAAYTTRSLTINDSGRVDVAFGCTFGAPNIVDRGIIVNNGTLNVGYLECSQSGFFENTGTLNGAVAFQKDSMGYMGGDSMYTSFVNGPVLCYPGSKLYFKVQDEINRGYLISTSGIRAGGALKLNLVGSIPLGIPVRLMQAVNGIDGYFDSIEANQPGWVALYEPGFVSIVRSDKTVSGTVALQNYGGPISGMPVQVVVTNGVVSESSSAFLDASGAFTASFNMSGPVVVKVKAPHWLRGAAPAVNGNSSIAGLSFSLVNGDVDADNDVDIDDYDILADAYGSVLGDASFNPSADLDGDEDVDIDDYDVLAGAYGLVGAG